MPNLALRRQLEERIERELEERIEAVRRFAEEHTYEGPLPERKLESKPVSSRKTLGMQATRWAQCVGAVAAGSFSVVFGVVWLVAAWQTLSMQEALAITLAGVSLVLGTVLFAVTER
jgi:predicted phage tail protein